MPIHTVELTPAEEAALAKVDFDLASNDYEVNRVILQHAAQLAASLGIA